jgi:CTP synthase (UTP-ammonia lyase)
VQVIPHVTDMIKEFVMTDIDDLDFLLVEIGGTVGDIEGLPFFEAIRQLGNELGRERSCFVHLTLVPYIGAAGELKTKPTQHSVKELRAIGIAPDILLCRAEKPIPEDERRKIALFCNVYPERVIQALDLNTIYEAPVAYHNQGFDTQVLKVFGIADAPSPDLSRWNTVVDHVRNPEGEVRIAVVGKYMQVKDSYKSLSEALTHGGIANNVRVQLDWIDSEIFERDDAATFLENVDGILVPGGFGERGVEGKIKAVKFARERHVPFFGICYGLHMAVIEAARDLAGFEGAGTSETPRRHRADDRMDQRQRRRDAYGGWRSRRHDASRRLSRGPFARKSRGRSLWHDANLRTSPPSLRGEHAVRKITRGARSGRVRLVPGWQIAGDHGNPRSPLVHRRAVPSRTQIAPVRPTPFVCIVHRCSGPAKPPCVTIFHGLQEPIDPEGVLQLVKGCKQRLSL